MADSLPDFDQLDFSTGMPKQPQFSLMAPQQSFSQGPLSEAQKQSLWYLKPEDKTQYLQIF